MVDLFNLLAPIYDHGIKPPDPAMLQEILRLPVTGYLLDAGGGTGRIATLLKPLVGKVIICDGSLQMLQQSRQKGQLNPVHATVERLPYPSSGFERVVVVDALHHFANQQQAIGELLRVLKPGGRLVIEEPDINRFAVKLIALAETLALMGSHFYSPVAIKTIIARYGYPAQIITNAQFSAWVVVDK